MGLLRAFVDVCRGLVYNDQPRLEELRRPARPANAVWYVGGNEVCSRPACDERTAPCGAPGCKAKPPRLIDRGLFRRPRRRERV